MERACFLLRVKQDRLPEYVQNHTVWPEMLEAMRSVSLHNYSLFYRPDGLVVGYLEGEDIHGSLRRLGETEVNARWQATMAPYFECGSGDLETDGPEWLTPYFYMA